MRNATWLVRHVFDRWTSLLVCIQLSTPLTSAKFEGVFNPDVSSRTRTYNRLIKSQEHYHFAMDTKHVLSRTRTYIALIKSQVHYQLCYYNNQSMLDLYQQPCR